jgi:hypothetical protein
MFNYAKNILLDMYYGYITVYCENKNCRAPYKFTRNEYESHHTTTFCCNMGCSLATYNQMNNINNE